ncbi:MAG: EAL domain-containing protein [Xanthomonas sp.]|uniref:putative bifunctional diguanylate cyclase/phosphodiesterase n=1 Tax=Pseudoxanthomonas mexicana TaxID=128785 RepID=UPI0009FAEC3B|nr:EAL domain-containing protein [Pseudoxanthomonas mexicana]MBA3928245.1 EAL domain-containing protein [Xanthomonas sp.]MBL8255141.1 EAL domain-containing protein [Pseudoxanthomonas mexicana]
MDAPIDNAQAVGWPGMMDRRRRRRAFYLLLATGLIMLLLGLGWATFFAWRGAWPIVAVELAIALLGLVVIVMARLHRPRAASWVAFAGLSMLLCFFSTFLDVSTDAVPRTSHVFLLVLALCAHHVFRDERPWLRYGMVVVLLVLFAVFAGAPIRLPYSFAIAEDVRRVGIWVNLATAMASFLVVLRLAETDVAEHRALHRALRDALSQRRFMLLYQPQVDARGRIIGAEALLRWHDARRGLIRPADFMQAAEDTGFILPLGQWVLNEACRQLAAWQSQPALRRLRLSVNVSALQLRQPDFVQQVDDAVTRSGIDAGLLTLELTESVLVHDMDDAVAKMRALHAMGVRLSLDDFGAGYSSLSYLRELPFAEMKIDRAFTRGIVRDAQAATITRNLLQLGRDLGIDVIAEGIEHEDQFALLGEQGCRLFQGYLFGRPMDVDAFKQRIASTP